MPSTPLDLAFTTWASYPFSPSDVGSGDINRLQAAVAWLADPPSACLSFTGTGIYPSSFAFANLLWNNTVWNNTPGMVPTSMDLTHYTDRIPIVYPGKYKCELRIRSQYSNTTGLAQIKMLYTDTGGDKDMDADSGDCSAIKPLFLRAEQEIVIDAAHVANGACIRAQYVQASGGDATITNSPLAVWPRLTVTWIGTGA